MNNYILRKDLFDIKTGSEIVPSTYGMAVLHGQSEAGFPFYYVQKGTVNPLLPKKWVENNPEWFAVKDTSEKKYRFIHYEEVKTMSEWISIFPYLQGKDFNDPSWGFQLVTEQPVYFCKRIANLRRAPLGIVPEYIWKEQRLEDIRQALIRFNEFYNSRREAPKEWLYEKHEIEKWILDRKSKHTINNKWQIQCIVHNGKNCWLQSDGLYKSGLMDTHLPYQWFLANGGKIYSVIRKSDKQLFTIGDFIKVKKDSLRKGWSDAITGFIIPNLQQDVEMIVEFETWRQPLCDLERMHKDIFVSPSLKFEEGKPFGNGIILDVKENHIGVTLTIGHNNNNNSDGKILSFLLVKHQEVIDMKSFGVYPVNYYLNKIKEYSIYSVERTRDGKVFKVGDKCKEGTIRRIIVRPINPMSEKKQIWFCTNDNNDRGFCMSIAHKKI